MKVTERKVLNDGTIWKVFMDGDYVVMVHLIHYIVCWHCVRTFELVFPNTLMTHGSDSSTELVFNCSIAAPARRSPPHYKQVFICILV